MSSVEWRADLETCHYWMNKKKKKMDKINHKKPTDSISVFPELCNDMSNIQGQREDYD